MMEMDDHHELLMFRLDTRLTRCQQKRNGWEILVYIRIEARVDATVKDFRLRLISTTDSSITSMHAAERHV